MKLEGLPIGYIKPLRNGIRPFTDIFEEYLDVLKVPYSPACCSAITTNLTVSYNSVIPQLQYWDGTQYVAITTSEGTPTLEQILNSGEDLISSHTITSTDNLTLSIDGILMINSTQNALILGSGPGAGITIGTINDTEYVSINAQQGLVFPRITEAQRLVLLSPIGAHVYQTDGTEGVYVVKSTGWHFAY